MIWLSPLGPYSGPSGDNTMPISDAQREAVRQSNYRRSEQTREMNRNRVWTPEMVEKMRATKEARTRKQRLEQVNDLGLGHGIYKVYVSKSGYVHVGVIDHPYYGTNGDVPLHRIIASEHLGRIPTSEEHGHHVDENKLNNEPENIQVLLRSDHMSLHAKKRIVTEARRQAVSRQFKGKKLSEEHKAKLAARPQTEEERLKRGASVRATCAAKREAGTHKRGPDPEDVRKRKAEAARAAWARRRAAGTDTFGPRSEDAKLRQSETMRKTWAARKAQEAEKG